MKTPSNQLIELKDGERKSLETRRFTGANCPSKVSMPCSKRSKRVSREGWGVRIDVWRHHRLVPRRFSGFLAVVSAQGSWVKLKNAKAQGRLNAKGGAPRPVFRPSHGLLRRDYRRYSQEALEYEADNVNWRHLSSFLCSFTSLLHCELTCERDCEKPLWLLPLQFSGFGVATLFCTHGFLQDFGAKNKGLKNRKKCQEKLHM